MTPRTIVNAAARLAAGELSAVELTTAHLDAIAAKNEELNAYLLVDREGALAAARAADERRAAGASLGTLDGIPLSIKYIIVTKGLTTTATAKMLKDNIPP